jgi:hypothetical protein
MKMVEARNAHFILRRDRPSYGPLALTSSAVFGVISMTKFIVCVTCVLAFCLSATALDAFERARPKTTAAKSKSAAENAKTASCDLPREPRAAYRPCTYPKNNGIASPKSGSAEIIVVDENDKSLPGFCVRIDGKAVGESPLRDIPIEAGKKVIEVHHEDVGEGCQQATIKSGEISKVAFQFFRLREEVTPLHTSVMEWQQHGSIVVLSAFSEATDVFVDRKGVWDPKLFDSRIAKGSGSLKISNLSPDTYVVELRSKNGKEILKCGALPCSAEVELERCTTLTIKASPSMLDIAQPEPVPCVEPTKPKTAKKRVRAKQKTTHARRRHWR